MNQYEGAQKLDELFGRFEYALKRTGHIKKGRSDAQADWESFAASLGRNFYDEVTSYGVAKTLINDPPRKLKSDGLQWQPIQPPPLSSVVELFVQGVCRVRNSRVHGEKFRSHGPQWERDGALVREALAVLQLAQSKDEQVAKLIEVEGSRCAEK